MNIDNYDFFSLQLVGFIEDFCRSTYKRIEELSSLLEYKTKDEELFTVDENTETHDIKDSEAIEFFEALIDIKAYNKTSFLYNSFFISNYSFFEHTLITYCKYLNERDSKNFSFKTNSEKYIYIDRCIEFLKQEYRFDFRENSNYNQLILYQKTRNIFVHNQSILPDDDEFLIIKSIKGLHLTEGNVIYIRDTEIILDFINRINKFLIKDIIDKTQKV